MNPTLVLWPMILHGLLTCFLYIPMSFVRRRTVTHGGVRAGTYRLLRDEPEESLKFSNAIRNQNESGLIFYAACLTAYVTDGASFLTAMLAWLFLLLKALHVAIQTTANRLRFRRPAFMTAYLVLVLFWLVNAAHLAGMV